MSEDTGAILCVILFNIEKVNRKSVSAC